jgi:hypothetical protein
MHLMIKTAEAIVPAFLLIGAGWLFRRVNLLSENLVTGLNRLLFVVVLPILLFQKIGSQPLSEAFSGTLIIGTYISFGLMWVISFAAVKINGKISPDRQGVIIQGASRPNTIVVGLAVLAEAWGEAVYAPAGMLLGALVPFMNVMSVFALLLPHRDNSGLKGFGRMATAVVTNPLVIGAVLGVARSASGIRIPGMLDSAFKMLSDMAIPAALIGAGGSLKMDKVRGDFRASMATSALKLLVMPALTWAILGGIFHVSGMNLGIGVMFASAPVATVSFIMADQMEGDSDLAASILVLTHLFAILTMSLWLASLFQWG